MGPKTAKTDPKAAKNAPRTVTTHGQGNPAVPAPSPEPDTAPGTTPSSPADAEQADAIAQQILGSYGLAPEQLQGAGAQPPNFGALESAIGSARGIVGNAEEGTADPNLGPYDTGDPELDAQILERLREGIAEVEDVLRVIGQTESDIAGQLPTT
jgi:hypothetical protein